MRFFRKKDSSSKPAGMNPHHTIISFLIAIALAAPQAPRPACSPQINQLAAGIQRNIEAQRGESASVQAIGQLLQSSQGDQVAPAQFEPAKTKLLQFVNDGIQIRVNNQQLAKGNRAEAGLAKVEMAQKTELMLSQGLSGSKGKDLATVQSLSEMFAGGTKQNMQNLADATADCTVGRV